MPRLARLVIPDIAHHVTHRGNRRGAIFLDDEDRSIYRGVLSRYLEKADCPLWAYCWMKNHVHLLVDPRHENSLSRRVGLAHRRYAQLWNRRHRQSGHLFEGRYYSTPLDDRHTWAAARYIERNPVRAKLATRATDWSWTSARAHALGEEDALLDPNRPFPDPERTGVPWADWLAIETPADGLEDSRLRSRTTTGRPCGDPTWVRSLEHQTGRENLDRKPGRPRAAPEGGAINDEIDLFGGQ